MASSGRIRVLWVTCLVGGHGASAIAGGDGRGVPADRAHGESAIQGSRAVTPPATLDRGPALRNLPLSSPMSPQNSVSFPMHRLLCIRIFNHPYLVSIDMFSPLVYRNLLHCPMELCMHGIVFIHLFYYINVNVLNFD
jgi:hypothetical protein